jgi:hypothetical protein
MLLIFCPSENVIRLAYAAKHLLSSLSGIDFEITGDRTYFMNHDGASINYSSEPLNHGLQISPFGLLTEQGYTRISNLHENRWKNLYCPFFSGAGDIPFDIFSATFYLLTSYEEYFSNNLDEHGRFALSASLAFRRNFLEIPIVDRWAILLREELQQRFPALEIKPRKYRLVTTFDIDFPYQYRYSGLIKNTIHITKHLLKRDFSKIKEQLQVILHRQEDPYFETIKRIDNIFAQSGQKYILFVLFGKRGKYGLSNLYPTQEWYRLLPSLNAETGLHPSYDTFNNTNQLIKEKTKIETIINRSKTTLCRRHFLRYTCPRSFREASEAGFRDDYSLAFAHSPGFRSGTSAPYPFYDLETDTITQLQIHPTIIMDTTLIHHLKMTPEEACDKISRLAGECRAVGGDFTTLWHNSNLAGNNNPWYNIFIRTINTLQ